MDEILEILENNARISVKDIAKLTKKNEKEIEKKIKQYEEQGVIAKYKTMINRDRLPGSKSVIALIEVQVTPQKDVGFDQIAERIYRFPEVKNCYLLSGTYDLLLMVEGEDMHTAASFVAEKLAPLSSVKRTISHFMLKKYKESGTVLVKQDKSKRLNISY
jgi:DNA-binding Lrp family transcriptional regulator